MGTFVIKKIFNGIFVLFGVAVVIFFIFKIMPGDPVKMMLGQRSDESTKRALKEAKLGGISVLKLSFFLDVPSLAQLTTASSHRALW